MYIPVRSAGGGFATGEIPFKISRLSKHDGLLTAVREANEVANDLNTPTCTDSNIMVLQR